jgi:hypothetical protein
MYDKEGKFRSGLEDTPYAIHAMEGAVDLYELKQINDARIYSDTAAKIRKLSKNSFTGSTIQLLKQLTLPT